MLQDGSWQDEALLLGGWDVAETPPHVEQLEAPLPLGGGAEMSGGEEGTMTVGSVGTGIAAADTTKAATAETTANFIMLNEREG